MIRSPYQKYQQSSVQTASPAQLLLMLYDGAIKFVRIGIESIEKRQYEQANTNLVKAQAIINELVASLDMEYEISKNLAAIYEYMLYQLIQANINKKAAPANEVLTQLQELKGAWETASKSENAQRSTTYA